MSSNSRKYQCGVCGYIYDPALGEGRSGVKPGTAFEDLPQNWVCPVCGAIKELFKPFEATVSPVTAGADTEETPSHLRQEYGKPLGLRGIGLGLSYQANLRALSKVKLKTRLIGIHKTPEIAAKFFGREVGMPILGAPMSGFSYVSDITEEDFAYKIIEGCRLAQTLGFTGNTSKPYEIHPGIQALRKAGGLGVNIFKPQSQEVLMGLIKQSEEENAVAVGIDIDGAGSVNFTLAGKPVFRKTIKELSELKKSTKLPFIIKGVMCKEDALAAVEAGADMVAISNHGGRVLDSTPGVADVVPEIVKAVRAKNKKVIITADGGIRTGYDALKMLALGVNFVLVGRPLANQALTGGPENVAAVLNYFKEDLIKAMIMTSCNSLEDINESIIVRSA